MNKAMVEWRKECEGIAYERGETHNSAKRGRALMKNLNCDLEHACVLMDIEGEEKEKVLAWMAKQDAKRTK